MASHRIPSPLSRIQPALSLVAGRPREVFDLAALSSRAGLSAFHWHRLFSTVVGESPKQFAQRLRLSRAAALLLSRHDSVLSIALSCGFASHEGFTRAFRRRFGVSPRAYRARGFDRPHDRASARTHAALVTRVAPCIGLIHVAPDGRRPILQGTEMSYSIESKELKPQPVIVARRRVKRSEIAQTIGGALPAVFEYAQRHGKALASHPFTRYIQMGPGLVVIEPGMAIVGPPLNAGGTGGAPATGDAGMSGAIEDVLPGGLTAVTMHMGPYDQLVAAYEALETWIHAHGFEPAGAPWENYVTDPAEHPDPKDWKTEVCWPIRRGATL
jgi:AraC family transcriptional regulator